MFEQIVAVLARQADAAITDAALFRLADTCSQRLPALVKTG